MTNLSASAVRKPILLAALLCAAMFAARPADAQQRQRATAAEPGPSGVPNGYYVERGPRGVGGYSLTFSDIWGPAKMPPAPRDFGPHFDYPPESLNSAPLHDPYPN
jgi:hypothetical protein